MEPVEYNTLNYPDTPPEILENIIGFLNTREIKSLSETEKRIHSLELIQKMFLTEFVHNFTQEQIKKALEKSSHIKETADLPKDYISNKSLALAKAAKILSQMYRTEEAKKTLDQAEQEALSLTSTKERALAYTQIANAEIQIGAISNAQKTLQLAKSEASSIKNRKEKTFALIKVAEAERKIDSIENVSTTLAEAKKEALLIENGYDCYRSLAFTEIANVEMQIGALEDAIETLKQAKKEEHLLVKASTRDHSDNYTSSALKKVVETEITIGITTKNEEILNEALKTACSIKNIFIRSQAIAEVAQASMQIGLTEEANMILALAKQKAFLVNDHVPNHIHKTLALVEIAEVTHKLGHSEEASETLAEAKKQSLLIDNPYSGDKSFVLTKIAKAESTLGAHKDANETLAEAKKAAKQSTYAPSSALQRVSTTKAKIRAKRGNVLSVKKYLEKSNKREEQRELLDKIPEMAVKNHLNLAQRALQLVPIVVQSSTTKQDHISHVGDAPKFLSPEDLFMLHTQFGGQHQSPLLAALESLKI